MNAVVGGPSRTLIRCIRIHRLGVKRLRKQVFEGGLIFWNLTYRCCLLWRCRFQSNPTIVRGLRQS